MCHLHLLLPRLLCAPRCGWQVEKKLIYFRQKLVQNGLTLQLKDENKTVALGTAKINYME